MKLIKKKILRRADGLPYLIRYSLFDCRWFSIKLHKILKSDDACLHDHPWKFVSLILKNGYTEENEKHDLVRYKAGSILFRDANWKHRLIIDKPATTIVITFKKTRLWGFWTKQGFIPWFKYKQGQEHC